MEDLVEELVLVLKARNLSAGENINVCFFVKKKSLYSGVPSHCTHDCTHDFAAFKPFGGGLVFGNEFVAGLGGLGLGRDRRRSVLQADRPL